jgi:hypothetical protein
MLLAQAERRLGVAERLAAVMPDGRDASRVMVGNFNDGGTRPRRPTPGRARPRSSAWYGRMV